MNIVDKMIEYRDSRKTEIFDCIDSDNLTVIVTEILSWLKLERKREIWIEQGRKTTLKPMRLDMNYPWCNDLVKILEKDNAFSKVFCIKGKGMVFKEGIEPEYIHEARLLAYEKYNPQMIIG